MSKKNIAVVYGGDSSEIIVSRKSAQGVLSFIDKSLYNPIAVSVTQQNWVAEIEKQKFVIDKNDFTFLKEDVKISFECAYITIHGTPGEDGKLQGYFDMLNIPYTTCGVLPASLTFNKFTCNTYLKGFGVSVADSILVRKGIDFSAENILEKVGLPCFVKPNAGGSSFGISKVKTEDEITLAIEKAFEESNEVIIEGYIAGSEFTCGLYKTRQKEQIFPVTEVISANEFFDFEAKYTAEKVQEITPARLSGENTKRIQQISSLIYDILGCKGIIRVDFILSDNKIFLLEVNTTPGMTTTSFIPQQIASAKLEIHEVFTEIIEDAITRES